LLAFFAVNAIARTGGRLLKSSAHSVQNIRLAETANWGLMAQLRSSQRHHGAIVRGAKCGLQQKTCMAKMRHD
jgi:hypothetical protein